MNLKALSNSSTQLNGAVTFWLMPYRTLAVDAVITELERIDPQYEYVHDQTGVVSAAEPDGYARDLEAARAIGIPLDEASHWKRRSRWIGMHDCFWRCEALTTAIEVADGQQSAEVRALAQYWTARPATIAERWALFQAVISPAVANAWLSAWAATRDHSMDAPAALQGDGASDDEKKAEAPPLTPSLTA